MTDPNPADPNAPEPTMGDSAGGMGEPAPAAPPPMSAPAEPAMTAAPPPPAAPAPAPAAPSTGAGVAERPTGITILAVLAAIGGILGLFGGFIVFLGGTVLFGAAGGLLGLAALAYAGLLIAAAYGFWTLQPWAWPLGVAVAIFGIVISVIYIVGGASIASQLLGIVVDGVILYYLNQPTIRSLFGK
jgi:hypothetical protein